MDITMLKDISKVTTAPGIEFLALGGEIKVANQLLGALAGGVTYISRKGNKTWMPYLDVYPDIGIDYEYASFYHANKEPNRFYNLTEAMKAYNETVLANASKTGDIEGAESCLLRNIPKESPDLKLGWVKGEGYRSKSESVIILTSKPSQEDPKKNTVLLLKGCQMAVVEDVPINERFRCLDFDSVKPKFNITDVQEALNQFAIKAKGEVVYGTDEIESQLRQGGSPIAIENMFVSPQQSKPEERDR